MSRLPAEQCEKEDELREELEFHLANEADEREADGGRAEQARWAARRDLGNATLLREETRTLRTWTLVEQLAQDLRYAVRIMFKNRAFTALAALSLAGDWRRYRELQLYGRHPVAFAAGAGSRE